MSGRTGLWRHADFLRLWSAQAISAFGSRITRTALPIIAVKTLGEPESIIGILAALQLAPGVVLALFVGGFVDRARKRRILIAADLIRALTVASLTVTWALGVLSIVHVVIVGSIVGAATALFQIADVAYLPIVIDRRDLTEGNSKRESTEAIAEITGPASAGALIAVLGAPLAVVIDAASYLWSAVMLGWIKTVEPQAAAIEPAGTSSARVRGGDLRIGLRAVFGNPFVRPIVLGLMVWAILGGFFMSLYTLFCLRELQLSEAMFGVIIAMGGVGSLAGALLSRWLVRVLGLGRTLVIASALSVTLALLIPLAGSAVAGGSLALVVGLLVGHQLFGDCFAVVFLVLSVTLRQTVIDKEQLGRANAAIHVCTQGVLPIAAVIAGLIAECVGTRTAMWVGVSIGLLAPVLLLPLWKLREMPAA